MDRPIKAPPGPSIPSGWFSKPEPGLFLKKKKETFVKCFSLSVCSGGRPLKDTQELKNYLDTLYTSAAQYDSPYKHPVESICRGINGESKGRSDILDRIFSGVFNYHKGNLTCLNLTESSHSPESFSGWGWQASN